MGIRSKKDSIRGFTTTMSPCSHDLFRPTASVKTETILHLVGSPTDEFSFCLNIFYASSFDVTKHKEFQHIWAVIRPEDKNWTFTHDWACVVTTDKFKLIKDSNVEWFDLPNALAIISSDTKPALVMPHMFCLEGSTRYRSLMETIGIPFIGSSAQKTVLSMNKTMTRGVMVECGIPCPSGKVVFKDTLVNSSQGLDLALEKAFKHSSDVIIDKFIAGRELRCSVVENIDQFGNLKLVAMPPQEYHISKKSIRETGDKLFLDENGLPLGKAPSTKTSFICKETETELYGRIQKLAVKVHKVLQFKDFSMIDIRVDCNGNPWVLESNLFCSFGSQSVLNIHAEENGWTTEELFKTMVNNNFRRKI